MAPPFEQTLITHTQGLFVCNQCPRYPFAILPMAMISTIWRTVSYNDEIFGKAVKLHITRAQLNFDENRELRMRIDLQSEIRIRESTCDISH